MDIEQHLHEQELELLRPEIRRSAELVSSLLAEGFREFGSSGRVFSRDDMIAALPAEAPAQFSISDFRAQVLGAEIALVTYQAIRRDPQEQRPVVSWRSSLWVVRDGRWRMLFHQGTPVPAD